MLTAAILFCCRVREVPLEADDAAGRGQKQPGEGAPLSPPLHLLAFSLATGADSAAAAAALPPHFEARTASMDDIGEGLNPKIPAYVPARAGTEHCAYAGVRPVTDPAHVTARMHLRGKHGDVHVA